MAAPYIGDADETSGTFPIPFASATLYSVPCRYLLVQRRFQQLLQCVELRTPGLDSARFC